MDEDRQQYINLRTAFEKMFPQLKGSDWHTVTIYFPVNDAVQVKIGCHAQVDHEAVQALVAEFVQGKE